MITLTLLHPIKSTPIQSWRFERESVIRIGRAIDNNVVLYSAVVSRHHVELQRTGLHWKLINLGTNGTYLNGTRITQVSVQDGAIICLARSGPQIQIHFGRDFPKTQPEAQHNARYMQVEDVHTKTVTEEDTTEPIILPQAPESEARCSTPEQYRNISSSMAFVK